MTPRPESEEEPQAPALPLEPREPGSAPVVPGAVHRVRIDRRDERGRGVAALGRRALRVRNAHPGETVDVRLEHVGKAIAIGRVVGVAVPAGDRVADACPHGAECPGCGLRTLGLAARLEEKRRHVAEALSQARFDPGLVAACVPSPTEDGWRTKAYLVPRRTRRGILLGIYEEGTHDLVEIEGCPVHAPAVERTLRGVRIALQHLGADVFDERRGTGRLRGISVRASAATGDAIVVLVVATRDHRADRALADEVRRRAPPVVGVVRNVHPEPGNQPFGPLFEPVVGRDAIEEASGPFLLKVSAGSFFQVNPAVAALLVERLRAEAAAAPPGRAVDLYGGVGAAAVALAAEGRETVLVEASPAAAKDARANALRWAPGRVDVVAARAEDALASLEGRPTVVVANPPRSGLSPEVRGAIARSGAAAVLYVSCDPRSLARDMAEFRAAGLEPASVTPFDMIPQTPHAEALAVLRRSP